MKWNLLSILSIKVRFELRGNFYSFVWSHGRGFELVQLDADVDRPDVLSVIYSGVDIQAARDAIKALGG